MDLNKLKKLMALLDQYDINEIELKEGEEFIKINRHTETIKETSIVQAPQREERVSTKVSSIHQQETESVIEKKPEEEGTVIKSPMVGTFYSASSPDAAPYVKIGDQIKAGQVICIIEAMKMMNHIKADQSGKIKSILVENGQPLEYNQPLFILV